MSDPQLGNDDEAIRREILQANLVDDHAALWMRIGAFVFSLVLMGLLWIFMVGRKEASPKTEMVWPATAVLEKGIRNNRDLKSLAKDLNIPLTVPDLRQVGGKLVKSSSATLGGVKAIVMQFQFGRSQFLLYRLDHASTFFKDMRQSKGKNCGFYVTSSGSVSVVAWQDKHRRFYALAAKATEADILSLADKVVAELK